MVPGEESSDGSIVELEHARGDGPSSCDGGAEDGAEVVERHDDSDGEELEPMPVPSCVRVRRTVLACKSDDKGVLTYPLGMTFGLLRHSYGRNYIAAHCLAHGPLCRLNRTVNTYRL